MTIKDLASPVSTGQMQQFSVYRIDGCSGAVSCTPVALSYPEIQTVKSKGKPTELEVKQQPSLN